LKKKKVDLTKKEAEAKEELKKQKFEF